MECNAAKRGSFRTMTDHQASFEPIKDMSERLRDWHKVAGRHDLPWQHQGPYATWVSEIMLQQTQVSVVIPYYLRFMEAFPTIKMLAAAPQDRVLAHWAGLGYYARARHLHHAAKQVMAEFGGTIPQTLDALVSLKGIGRSTAGAIQSLGWKRHGVIQDGNVRRVLARLHAIEGDLLSTRVQSVLWRLAETYTPTDGDDAAVHTQAIMDLGALLCTRHAPKCAACPLQRDCQALKDGRTHLLPTPKKAIAKPTIEWFVLGLRNSEGALWCSRRPERGIWGGLYCPPTGASLHTLLTECGLSVDIEWNEGPTLSHAFSHFSVYLRYVDILVADFELSGLGAWITPEAYDIGLPAPIKRLVGWD